MGCRKQEVACETNLASLGSCCGIDQRVRCRLEKTDPLADAHLDATRILVTRKKKGILTEGLHYGIEAGFII